LAGLGPEDVSRAFQGALGLVSLQEQVAAGKEGRDIQRGELALRTFEAGQTTETKNYMFARRQGFKGSLIDFKNAALTTHEKDYNRAVADGYKGSFHDWLFAMAKAGAVNLGEITARKGATTEIASKAKITTPVRLADFWSTVEADIYENSEKYLTKSGDYDADMRKAIEEEGERRIQVAYPGAVKAKSKSTGIEGWYTRDGKFINIIYGE